MKIIAASNNQHKINEIRKVLDSDFQLISLEEIGINEEIPENENTLEGNALSKARFVYKLTKQNVFADDTGLEVKCLDNRPGVYSARYAGDQKNSEDNISLLLKEMKNSNNREARFRTVIALIYSGEEYLFEGIVEGKIAHSKSGKNGFGYDPVFLPQESSLTFAEMDIETKNTISHRARAIAKLSNFLKSGTNNI